MKNILIIQESFVGGGAEKVLIDLLQHFDYSRYRVTLLIEKAFGVHLQEIPQQIEQIHVFTKFGLFYRLVYHFKPIRDAYLRNKLTKLLGDRSFDTIVSFMEGPAIYLHQFLVDRAKRNVSWVHINLAKHHWTKYLHKSLSDERAIYNKMDSVAFVSEGARSAFINQFNFAGDTRVIYNIIPVDTIVARSEQAVVPTQKFTVCNIGRLNVQKRQDRFLAVMAELKRRGVDCEGWILGTGELEQQLKQQAAKCGVADMVKFLGFQTNPYPYLKASDMFLLTSDTEGYPLVVCEAMCLGKPIVSTNITGPDELLANGVGVLTSFEVSDIADRVQQLAADADLRAHYAEASRAEALRRFDVEAVMQQIYQIL
jgi:glycosyltransferase involved in cell wall biosynthesis